MYNDIKKENITKNKEYDGERHSVYYFGSSFLGFIQRADVFRSAEVEHK